MIKLNLKHVDAVTHAGRAMVPQIVPSMSPKHRQAIEDDLILLTDVKAFILRVIYEPGLPLSPANPETNVTDGNADRDTSVRK